jgi:hypothetical protein
MDRYCEKHALEKLQRLDFSQLASSTSSADVHEHEQTLDKRWAALELMVVT